MLHAASLVEHSLIVWSLPSLIFDVLQVNKCPLLWGEPCLLLPVLHLQVTCRAIGSWTVTT